MEKKNNKYHNSFPPDPEARVKALKTILETKGLVEQEALDEILDTYQNKVGPINGAKLIAKAWIDASFKNDLLEKTEKVLTELNLSGRQGEHVTVVENTSEIHNLVVCTLCSCYPWPLLGLPPAWDKYYGRKILANRAAIQGAPAG